MKYSQFELFNKCEKNSNLALEFIGAILLIELQGYMNFSSLFVSSP